MTRGAEAANPPKITSALYDRSAARVVVGFSNGLELAFPPRLAEGLDGASPGDLATIEISPTGLGLHWPKLNVDVYLPTLIGGLFASQSSMAQLWPTAALKRRAAKPN